MVASTDLPREERSRRLYLLCAITYCKHNLRKITGLCSEPLQTKARSYDVMILHRVGFKNRWQLAQKARHMFGHERGFQLEEYRDTQMREFEAATD